MIIAIMLMGPAGFIAVIIGGLILSLFDTNYFDSIVYIISGLMIVTSIGLLAYIHLYYKPKIKNKETI